MAGISAFCLAGTAAASGRRPSTGIIFVAASWCPICKRAAPMLDLFAKRHQLDVLVASYDARPIEPFPTFVDSRAHPIAQSITSLPTTLVYSARQNGLVGQLEGYRNPQWYLANLLGLVQQGEAMS